VPAQAFALVAVVAVAAQQAVADRVAGCGQPAHDQVAADRFGVERVIGRGGQHCRMASRSSTACAEVVTPTPTPTGPVINSARTPRR
jgi:hypothetical protein